MWKGGGWGCGGENDGGWGWGILWGEGLEYGGRGEKRVEEMKVGDIGERCRRKKRR